MILVYGIVDAKVRLPRGLKRIEADGLSAVVREVSEKDLEPTIPKILAYENIVEAIHKQTTVVPMRYGSIAESEAQIAERLAEDAEKYSELLDRIDGCVEMGVRALEAKRPRKAATGRDYLAIRKEHYASNDKLAEEIRGVVKGLFVDSKVERGAFSMPFLLKREKVAAFRKAFRPLLERGLLLSGPWPPYNFVT